MNLPTLLRGLLLLSLPLTVSCRSMYYSAMESIGNEKRDILISRVEKGRSAQVEAKEQFKTTLEAFNELTGASEATELETKYNKLSASYDSCEKRARAVSERIQSIQTVGNDLFSEWSEELSQITSTELRAGQEEVMVDTRQRFDELVAKMQKAETSMAPVLAAFKDRVLVLKSMLNAQAISQLQGTSIEINDDVTELIAVMQASIDEADEYLAAEARP